MGAEIAIGIAVAIILVVLSWLYKLAMFKKDEAVLLKFLQQSNQDTEHNFRSSEAIAAHTNITVDRVSVVCSKSSKIRRNTKEKESWCLS